jgi:hypothetical protein
MQGVNNSYITFCEGGLPDSLTGTNRRTRIRLNWRPNLGLSDRNINTKLHGGSLFFYVITVI